MTATPAASIVIRCHDEVLRLPDLLAGLAAQSFRDFEIVAVDSGSTDGTIDLLRDQGVALEHIDREEFSFGRSLNRGCRAARGDFLVAVSAHCYPTDEKWLENLLADFADPRVAAVYGMQRGAPDSAFSERQIFRRWYPEESAAHQAEPFLNNANCAVRRAVWEQHPYDEELTGLEDVEWAVRVMRDGWRINYRADACVVHVHAETPRQIRHRYEREAITFQKVFPTEHFNLLDMVGLTVRNVVGDWRAARRERVLHRTLWPILRFRTAQFSGTYQGFHRRRAVSSSLKRRFYYPEEP